MRIPVLQACVISCAMASAVFIMTPAHHALAQEGRQGFGGIEAKKWVLGARAGFSPLTQSLTDDDPRISSDVGPLVNFQALYSLNTWLLVGSIESGGPATLIWDIKTQCRYCRPLSFGPSSLDQSCPM